MSSQDAHPNALYLMNGVPAIIGSDDPGILRGSISEEYVKLVQRYAYITYPRVKELVRNSIVCSFIKDPREVRLIGLRKSGNSLRQ